MHESLKKLNLIESKISEITNKNQLKTIPQIIAVSKTFPINNITPLLEKGHIHFGENKIQEAENKWSDLKKKYPNFKLHSLATIFINKQNQGMSYVNPNIRSLDLINTIESSLLSLTINC